MGGSDEPLSVLVVVASCSVGGVWCPAVVGIGGWRWWTAMVSRCRHWWGAGPLLALRGLAGSQWQSATSLCAVVHAWVIVVQLPSSGCCRHVVSLSGFAVVTLYCVIVLRHCRCHLLVGQVRKVRAWGAHHLWMKTDKACTNWNQGEKW